MNLLKFLMQLERKQTILMILSKFKAIMTVQVMEKVLISKNLILEIQPIQQKASKKKSAMM